MARAVINPRVRLDDPTVDVEDSASDPVTPQMEESLASLAALSGVPLNNRSVTTFISEISNSQFAATIQGAKR